MTTPINPTLNPTIASTSSNGSTTATELQYVSAAPLTGYGSASEQDKNSWYVAMARAWGQALDHQADVISEKSNSIGNGGDDNPGTIVQLSAEAQRFSFLANSASTATNSVGEALGTLGRKQ